jgi:hypothetical protein
MASIDKLIEAATNEWIFFGSGTWKLDGSTTDGKKEYQDGAWQRVGDYWKFIGGAYSNLTGKDRGYPWSAAFISYCMNAAGAGGAFSYSAGHSTYINESIRAKNSSNQGALFWGWGKSERPVAPGDLIGYWRGDKKITVENAPTVGWYQSHTDIVVEVGPKYAFVIGGNVGHSVTRKQVRLSSDGFLTDSRYPWFVVMENRF